MFAVAGAPARRDANRGTTMSHYLIRIFISAALVSLVGAVGGVFNAFFSDNGFVLPQLVDDGKGGRILRPGGLGTVAVGAFAALLSWMLYGPVANYSIFGPADGQKLPDLTLGAVGAAAIVGFGGARWLTNEVDKRLLKAAAVVAASKPAATPAVAQAMAVASPAQALQLAKDMPAAGS